MSFVENLTPTPVEAYTTIGQAQDAAATLKVGFDLAIAKLNAFISEAAQKQSDALAGVADAQAQAKVYTDKVGDLAALNAQIDAANATLAAVQAKIDAAEVAWEAFVKKAQ